MSADTLTVDAAAYEARKAAAEADFEFLVLNDELTAAHVRKLSPSEAVRFAFVLGHTIGQRDGERRMRDQMD